MFLNRALSHACLFAVITMTSAAQMQEVFRRADAVCFDVDSTVIREEGIDELAHFCGVGDAVSEMSVKLLTTLNTCSLTCVHNVTYGGIFFYAMKICMRMVRFVKVCIRL